MSTRSITAFVGAVAATSPSRKYHAYNVYDEGAEARNRVSYEQQQKIQLTNSLFHDQFNSYFKPRYFMFIYVMTNQTKKKSKLEIIKYLNIIQAFGSNTIIPWKPMDACGEHPKIIQKKQVIAFAQPLNQSSFIDLPLLFVGEVVALHTFKGYAFQGSCIQ